MGQLGSGQEVFKSHGSSQVTLYRSYLPEVMGLVKSAEN